MARNYIERDAVGDHAPVRHLERTSRALSVQVVLGPLQLNRVQNSEILRSSVLKAAGQDPVLRHERLRRRPCAGTIVLPPPGA
jgi:hypothetical protein